MSFWSQYGRYYAFWLMLVVGLVFIVYFRKRRERRLASGWQLAENTNPLVKHALELANLLIGMTLGAILAERFHVPSDAFFIPAFLILFLAPKQKWVPPLIAIDRTPDEAK